MSRIVVPARTRLVYVESRGWLLGKLGFRVLVLTGVIFVWGPLVAGRPYTMRLVGWLVWAAIALLALGAVVRVGEAIWGAGSTAYVLVRSLAEAVAALPSAMGRSARSSAVVSVGLSRRVAIPRSARCGPNTPLRAPRSLTPIRLCCQLAPARRRSRRASPRALSTAATRSVSS